jgi:pSer/pThr/pTyr-binding forkhead associated (FHA) protein
MYVASIEGSTSFSSRGSLRMEARFTVISGPFRGQTFQIPRGKFIIGREPDCHLLLNGSFVSRHHCVLLMDDYTVRIRDLGSKNGTYVNGDLAPTGERILAHGDTVRVADLVIRVDLESVGGAMPAASLETDVVERDTTQLDGRPREKPEADQRSSPEVSEAAPRGAVTPRDER